MQIIPFLSFLLFPHRPAFHPWSGRHPRGALPVRTRRLWRWGGEVAQRIAAPLDVWMLKWNLLFMNLFTVVPVVKENVSFFFVFFSCVALNICDWARNISLALRREAVIQFRTEVWRNSQQSAALFRTQFKGSPLSFKLSCCLPDLRFGSRFRHFDNQMRGTLWHWLTFAALCVQVWDIFI